MATGQIQTYGLTGGVTPLNVEDMIYLLTPSDVPFQGTYNDPNSETPPTGPRNSRLGMESVDQKKVEWIEDELLPARSLLAEAGFDSSETDLTVTTGDGKKFAIGHVIRVDDEFMRVTAVTGDVLTVTRGFGDSSGAAHNEGAAVVGTGTALAEGSAPGDAKWVDRSGKFNYTQIFGPYKIELSGTEQAVRHYGVSDERSYQVQKRVKEIAIEFEQAIMYGQREEDTSNKWRTMGGMLHYITTNVDSTTTSLDEDALLALMQDSYDQGGVIDLIAVGGTQKRNISAFNSSNIRLARADRIRGQVVDVYVSDFGEADILLNRHIRVSDLIGLDSQFVSLGTLRPLVVEPLGKVGDATLDQIVCEKTLKLRMEKRHARASALTA